MKKSHCENLSRVSSRTTLAASLMLLGAFAAFAAGAARAADRSDANASCRQETKRVAVWPKGPKAAQQAPRFENREVTVCDGKVVSRRPADAALQANDNAQ
jgi:hypothetical protein